MSYTRTIEDVLDDMPFTDAEIMTAYINDTADATAGLELQLEELTRDYSKAVAAVDNLRVERNHALESKLQAEAAMVAVAKKLSAAESRAAELMNVLNAQQQSMTLMNIKLGGIAMLLQGK